MPSGTALRHTPYAAVAAGDEVAGELLCLALLGGEADLGAGAGDVVDRLDLGLEMDLPAGLQPELDQILQHLVLGIDGDHPAVGELLQVDAVVAAQKADVEAVMDEAFALQPVAGADLGHQVDRALLEHAGPDRGFDRLA